MDAPKTLLRWGIWVRLKPVFSTAPKSNSTKFWVLFPIFDFKACRLWNRHLGPLSFLDVDNAVFGECFQGSGQIAFLASGQIRQLADVIFGGHL